MRIEFMADNVSPEELRKEFDKQISELKKEIGTLSKTLADRGSQAYERTKDAASDALGRAQGQARSSLQQARDQAQLVSDTVRENPGTAATVLSSAGVVGFVIGLIVGTSLAGASRRW
jgi:ElaB/YqjD/DUF883 family membrane-anchored ribosome-binding protein